MMSTGSENQEFKRAFYKILNPRENDYRRESTTRKAQRLAQDEANFAL